MSLIKIFRGKKEEVEHPKFEFSFEGDSLSELKTNNENITMMFQSLRDDIAHIVVNDALEMLVNDGPIEIVDNQLQKSLLPDFKTKYVNILAIIKFIRLKNTLKGVEKFTAEFFEQMIIRSGDVVDDMIEILEKNDLSIGVSSETLLESVFLSKKMTGKINDNIITEDGDKIKEQIMRVKANNDIIEFIKTFFTLFGKLEAIGKFNEL